MEGRLEVPIHVSHNAFSLSNPTFMVGGPLADGTLQVDLAEDIVGYTHMAVIGEQAGPLLADGLINPRFEFPNPTPSRVIVGRLKLTVHSARQLAALLLDHANGAEQLMANAAASAGAASNP